MACTPWDPTTGLPPAAPTPSPWEPFELLACAGPDQVLTRGLPAELDSRCSRLVGGAELRSRLWRQSGGERVTLDSAVVEQARLSAPAHVDELEFGLELRGDSLLSRDSARVQVVDGTPVAAPVALTAGDQRTADGALVLDASRSVGVDASIQAARWSQLVGEPAVLTTPAELRTQVQLAAQAAAAVFAVEVQDRNGLWSEPEFVVVRRGETTAAPIDPPQLVAPPFVGPGASFVLAPSPSADTLDGWQSLRQLRGEPLTWTEQPDGTLALVAPRRPQRLVFRLDQEAAGQRLAPALAVVQVTAGLGNRAPVADAGPDRAVRPDHGVALNGSRSLDPDGSALQEYRWWQVLGVPVRLACHLALCTFDAPSSAAALAFALVVSDGTAESAADVVVIEVDAAAVNQPPVASAGGERWSTPGSTVTLDGRSSDDPDSGRIASFGWEQLPPLQPEVILVPAGDGTATFVAPSTPTVLHFRLSVCDADQACSTDDSTIHIEPAGPYVDAQRGQDSGDGTAERPCRTLEQGLDVARRFGLGELRMASGEHVVAQPVALPAEFTLSGGWSWSGATYAAVTSERSALGVAGVDALTLDSGSSLERLVLRPLPATAVVARRRLVVMGPRSALRSVTVTGPALADEVVSVEVGDGHRVEIVDTTLRGGIGGHRSVVLQAGTASDVLVRDSQVELGRAPRVVGIASADGQLTLQRCGLRAGAAEGEVSEVTGVDVVRSEVLIQAGELALDDAGWSPVPLAITLRCHRCQPTLQAQTQVRGPGRVQPQGRGVAVSLFLARDAVVEGSVVGGSESPGAELVALEATGGTLTLQHAELRACDDGLAASAVALALDAVQVTATEVDLHATAVERALAVQLVGLSSPRLELRQVHAAAAAAWAVADGWQADLISPAAGSSQLVLDVLGSAQVVGSVEATGLALRGTQHASVQWRGLQVSGPQTSRGVAVEAAVGVELTIAAAWVEADGGLGLAQGVLCQGVDQDLADLRLSRSVLQVQGAVASGLTASACDAAIIASVVQASGAVDAQAVLTRGPLSVNSSYLLAPGARQATVVLQAGAAGQLINSVVSVAADGAALDVAEDADQWLALHHVLFEHQARPLLTVRGSALASADADLVALRSRFRELRSVPDAGLDLTGHLTSALSPAVDAADPATVSLEDIDGQARPIGAGPDLGPDEAY